MNNPAVEKAWAELERYSMLEHAATELHEHMSIAVMDLRYRLDEIERLRAIEQAKAPATTIIQRRYPCGCVACICDDDEKCHGCGAKNCGKKESGGCDWVKVVDVLPPAPDDAAAIEAARKAYCNLNGGALFADIIGVCRAYHAEASKLDAATIAELRRQLAERDKIIKRWSDVGMKYYPPNWACDFGNPEMVIGNIVRWWQDQLADRDADLERASQPWRVKISVPDPVDHHVHHECNVIDIGHSDRVLIVECPQLAARAGRAVMEREKEKKQ